MKLSTRFLALGIALICATSMVSAQFMAPIQYWRAYDKTGLNVFETSKTAGAEYKGLAVRIGGGFTQGYQYLTHTNYAENRLDSIKDNLLTGPLLRADSANLLYDMTAGFNNASANLNIDAQLASGVRLNLVLYLSSRHHNETWVKGGYIQFDELGFLGSEFLDDLMKYLTIRLGHMEVNFGDQHFRRSDGGSTIYNPFAENYIIDAFTTEIGGDITFQSNGILGVVGITNGEIKGNIVPINDTTTATPAIYLKLGYDSQVNEDLRFRVTGSMYTQSQSPRNTLYAGDRTGSNYFMPMEKQYATYNTTMSNPTNQFTSGRMNPGFANNVTAFSISALLQFSGLEFFGTYDMASGSNSLTEKNGGQVEAIGERSMSQIAADLLYYFGASRNVYVGGRFNLATMELPGAVNTNGTATDFSDDEYYQASVQRIAVAAGWYILDQMLLKGEYVYQTYNDFDFGTATPDYRKDGQFSGVVIQAVVGF